MLGSTVHGEDRLLFYSKVAEVDKNGNLDGEDTSTSDQNSQGQSKEVTDTQDYKKKLALCGNTKFQLRLPIEFQNLSYMSRGGHYFDGMMRDIPNKIFRQTFYKTDFKNFKIVGQFNKSFIVATLGSELFILD